MSANAALDDLPGYIFQSAPAFRLFIEGEVLRLSIAAGHDDIGASACQGQRNGAAEASFSGGPGHDSHLVHQFFHLRVIWMNQ
jgi:hypothetical protein